MTTTPQEPIWRPSAERVARSPMTKFWRRIEEEHGVELADYSARHRWSVHSSDLFWQAVWDFTGVRASESATSVVAKATQFPGARWFPGARLNYAENLLSRQDGGPALIGRLENGERKVISWRAMRDQVAHVAAAMRSLGVEQGDRVAGMLPNTPETVVAMLAASSIGAIWSSCSPDFGVSGVLDRFGQIAPKVLFACDGYYYNGKSNDCRAKVAEISAHLEGLSATITVPILDLPLPLGTSAWGDLFASNEVPPLAFAQLPFDHPLFIMYSSGTTGAPKCIVHSAGGTLLQHLKEHQLHTGIQADDVVFFFTTCGWMMWNWLVSGLASGATLLLYDGSPFSPGRRALFDMAEEESVSVFGVGAKYLQAVEKAKIEPIKTHKFKALRTILSTGSPLMPDSYRFVYQRVANDVCLSSISGGTDIISCFALGNETLPVYVGELQCLGLGMAVEVWDPDGQSITQAKGELVCTQPFPSAPIGFWNDPDGSKYRRAYFETFPGVWAHGDYAELTAHGGLVIHGRSDAILNPGGVRIGTAEIYQQVERLREIADSVCVGQQWQGDVRVVLFVVLSEDAVLDDALEQKIREAIRQGTTPRHVPSKIIAVADVPRTRSGKIAEIAVKKTIDGDGAVSTEGLANPESLALFEDLLALNN